MKRGPNPYNPPVDEIEDELAFEEFLEMSDEQLDAELENLDRELDASLRAATPLQIYRWSRRNILASCWSLRTALEHSSLKFLREYLKKRQRRLVEIRAQLYSGGTIGHA